jgi:endoglucanase
MLENMVEILRELSRIPGVSGAEDAVRRAIIQHIKQYCEYSTDALGNLLAHKKGAEKPARKLMLSAHMDEVGLIVTGIEDSGLLRFATVGGIDNRVILGKAVELDQSEICGVIGAKALHQLEEKEKEEPLPPDKLYIDVGAADKQDAEERVRQGFRAVFSAEFRRLGEHKLLGRAFDDRAGCALLIALIQSDLAFDCDFAFTVQEETGHAGASTAAYALEPEVSVVVEATTASDIPGVTKDMIICEQGKGPVISFMDKSAIYDSGLYGLAYSAAEKAGVPCQSKLGVFGGNESGAIQTARAGVRCLAVSLPCRYLHTPSCVLDTRDILSTYELLKAMISEAGKTL